MIVLCQEPPGIRKLFAQHALVIRQHTSQDNLFFALTTTAGLFDLPNLTLVFEHLS